ncbi:MAG: hypothetical protein LBV00_11485 [Propionibacteriaceae bacterium]|jgi:hypothetical protein|nr:hypothetical protein [Propionibacteriaceae bacterium]
MRKKAAAPTVILLCLVALALGVGVSAFLMPVPTPSGLESASPLTSAPVNEQVYDGAKEVAATLHVSAVVPLSVNTSGTVTAISLAAGSIISSGSVVLSVDSVPVIALHTTTPLYRDLKQGDEGADVLALENELARLGYPLASPSEQYGAQAAQAVAALRKAAGDSSKGTDLPLAQILWLPTQDVSASTVTAKLGASVKPDEPIAEVGGTLSSITADDPSRLALDVGPMIMQWGDASAPIAADGTVSDPAFIAAVQTSADYAAIRTSETPTSTPVKVRLETPVTTLRVPPAAVYSVRDGSGCIQSLGEPIPVTVVASDLKGTLVIPVGEARPQPSSVDIGPALTQSSC